MSRVRRSGWDRSCGRWSSTSPSSSCSASVSCAELIFETKTQSWKCNCLQLCSDRSTTDCIASQPHWRRISWARSTRSWSWLWRESPLRRTSGRFVIPWTCTYTCITKVYWVNVFLVCLVSWDSVPELALLDRRHRAALHERATVHSLPQPRVGTRSSASDPDWRGWMQRRPAVWGLGRRVPGHLQERSRVESSVRAVRNVQLNQRVSWRNCGIKLFTENNTHKECSGTPHLSIKLFMGNQGYL